MIEGALEMALFRVRGEPGVDPFALARCEALLRGYDARWAGEMADLEVLAVEVEFRAPLINPATGAPSLTYRLGGKLDALARQRSTGRMLIIEHKSAGSDVSIGSTYWTRLRLDSQISTYMAGAKALGYGASAVVYDVVSKGALRPLKATPIEARKVTRDGRLYANQREWDETPDEFRARLVEAIADKPDEFYARQEVVRLEEEVQDHAWDVWQLGRMIRESQLAQRAPKNSDSCVMFGRTCEYFPLCAGEAGLEDPRFKVIDQVHAELDEPGSSLELLTNSRLKAFRRCARYHHLRYLEGVVPVETSEALAFGTLLHLGLEQWWDWHRIADKHEAAAG